MAPRPSSFRSLVAVWALACGALASAQIVVPLPPQGQVRDQGPPQPTERRVPVGTSTIAGTVVSSDTGRPIRNARVSLNGQPQATLDAMAAARGEGGARGIAPPLTRGSAPAVAGGLRGSNISTGLTSVSRSTTTDSNGQFAFPRLPAGQYQLSINHNQFLSLNYGQKRFGGQGTYIALADGQQFTANASMYRGGVISGTVLGPDGDPLQNVPVRAWRYARPNGFKRLQTQGFAQTDDRGMYRMFNLQPGEYLVSATPNVDYNVMNSQTDQIERAIRSGQILPPAAPGLPPTVSVPIPQAPAGPQMNIQPQYLPTFSPSSPAPAGATSVNVVAGEERTNVDVFTRLVQATAVQVELATPLETGVTVQMQLINDDPATDTSEVGMSRPDPNGRVIFRGVRPGKYTLVAQTIPEPPRMTIINGVAQPQPPQPPPALTDAQRLWGRAALSVEGDPLMNVTMTLQPPRKISGTVLFDMQHPPDLTRTRLSVTIAPAPAPQPIYLNAPPQAQVNPDGSFTLTGVVPGRYMIRASGAGTTSATSDAATKAKDSP